VPPALCAVALRASRGHSRGNPPYSRGPLSIVHGRPSGIRDPPPAGPRVEKMTPRPLTTKISPSRSRSDKGGNNHF
jgi:hypothetical protein